MRKFVKLGDDFFVDPAVITGFKRISVVGSSPDATTIQCGMRYRALMGSHGNEVPWDLTEQQVDQILRVAKIDTVEVYGA